MKLLPAVPFLSSCPRFAVAVFALALSFTPFQVLRAQGGDNSLAAKLNLADTYLRAGQADRAIPLLEDLYHEQPDNYIFYDKLRQAFESLKRYADAVQLAESQVQRDPNNPVFLAEKGRLLYLNNDEVGALEAWEAALATNPSNRNTYRVVYQSMTEVRLLDRAIAVLEKGQEVLGAQANFQADLAYLYSQTGRHEEAFEQYLAILEHNDRQLNFVRSRLGRFTEQPEALQAGIAATERAVRRVPLNRAYRELLAWLYMEAGDYAKALDANRAIDRLEQEDGRVLYSFAQSAADAGAYDAASEAYAEILERYPDSPIAPEAKFGVALMQEQWARKTGEQAFDAEGKRIPAPHFDEALAAYRAFMEAYPGHKYFPEALRRIGTLQQDVYFELLPAEQTFREVLTRYPNDEAAAAAEYELGRLALLRGDLNPARMAFSRLVERLESGELADKARYELALIHFYQGEFEAARTVAEAINRNTSSLTANDAIELKVLLLENAGPDSLSTPLRMFARAHLLQRQRRPADATQALDKLLAEYGTHPLADDARFLRALTLRDAGQSEAAVTAFLEIPTLHPTSFRADRSLFMAAEIMEQDLGDTAGAIDMYTRLLTDYPGSLLTAETRSRIRKLRGDNV